MNRNTDYPDLQHETGKIIPSDFFENESEKTKLNWFCFEFALELQLRLKKALKVKLREWNIDAKVLAAYCIKFSKHMKKEVLLRVEDKIEKVRINHDDIAHLLPSVSDQIIDKMLTITGEAWDHHTESCTLCPTRCITERDEYCTMFDERYYYEEDNEPIMKTEPTVGRNDPCPCGSGKKYKKCCGKSS